MESHVYANDVYANERNMGLLVATLGMISHDDPGFGREVLGLGHHHLLITVSSLAH